MWTFAIGTSVYRLGDSDLAPTALVVETARQAPPGTALDLACGAGRNALWLAEHGWSVTAVDGAPAAIDILLKRASERALRVEAFLAPDSSHNSARPNTTSCSDQQTQHTSHQTSGQHNGPKVTPSINNPLKFDRLPKYGVNRLLELRAE